MQTLFCYSAAKHPSGIHHRMQRKMMGLLSICDRARYSIPGKPTREHAFRERMNLGIFASTDTHDPDHNEAVRLLQPVVRLQEVYTLLLKDLLGVRS